MYTKKSKISVLMLILIGELSICVSLQQPYNTVGLIMLSCMAIINMFVGYLMIFKKEEK